MLPVSKQKKGMCMHTYPLEDFASDKKDFWDTIWDIK